MQIALGVVRSWRDAWKLAEHSPFLLLVGLLVIAATVEGSAHAIAALSLLTVEDFDTGHCG
jgi:hypothetical protein